MSSGVIPTSSGYSMRLRLCPHRWGSSINHLITRTTHCLHGGQNRKPSRVFYTLKLARIMVSSQFWAGESETCIRTQPTFQVFEGCPGLPGCIPIAGLPETFSKHLHSGPRTHRISPVPIFLFCPAALPPSLECYWSNRWTSSLVHL